MKKCTFCDSELLLSEENESARCWLCGGTSFVDVEEGETRRRQKEKEKKELCCPAPGCSIYLVENYKKFCGDCGKPLMKATLELWLRKCVEPQLKNDSREVILLKFGLISEAWRMGLSKEGAEKTLDEYVKKMSTSASRPQESTTPTRSSSHVPRKVLPSHQRKETTSADSALTTTVRNRAKSFYKHMVVGGTVTNDLIYLSFEKIDSKDGLKDRAEFLSEVTNDHGTLILFTDGDKGWVFPNPDLPYRQKTLGSLFPGLTEDQYNNFKQYIEPVPVVRTEKKRWKVTGGESESAYAPTRDSTTTESKTARTNNAAAIFPISSVDYLAKLENFGDVVRHDTVRDIVVDGPEGKGELMLIRDYSAPKNAESHFVIPRITRFKSTDAFYNLYKKYYDCARPAAGDVWIIAPAVVSRVDGGWQLIAKGVLEVRDHLEKRKTTPPRGSEETPVSQDAKVQSVFTPDFSPSKEKRRLIFMAVIGTCFLAIVIFWILGSSPSRPLGNGNTNLSAAPENNNPPASTPSASSAADEEFKQVRQKRIRANLTERSEIVRVFEVAERKYLLDYRFPYEHAKLSIKGIISYPEAFSALFLAAEKAIDGEKGQKMLDDLMADKDGDFYKLSRGQEEWEVLVRALSSKDKTLLQGNVIK